MINYSKNFCIHSLIRNQISPDESDFAGSEAELASLKLEDDKVS